MPPKTNRVAVRFLQHWQKWNSSEVAGFNPKLAGQLVQAEVAEYYRPSQAEKRAAADPAPAGGSRRGQVSALQRQVEGLAGRQAEMETNLETTRAQLEDATQAASDAEAAAAEAATKTAEAEARLAEREAELEKLKAELKAKSPASKPASGKGAASTKK